MTIPLFCVFIAMTLLVLTKIPVAVAMNRKGGYDNKSPREQQKQLEDWGARALASHHNTIEAFPIFAAGVLVAHVAAPNHPWAAALAIGFIVARVLYTILYIVNIDKLRSLVWSAGYFCSLTLALLPAFP